MPYPRRSLPDDLPSRFSVGTAKRRGITPARLRQDDLRRPHRGARAVGPIAEAAVASTANGLTDFAAIDRAWEQPRLLLLDRVRDYLPVLPEGAFITGYAAAVIHRLPVPWRPQTAPIDVGVIRPRTAPRRPGIRGRQFTPGFVLPTVVDGIPVTDAMSTWAVLAAELDLYDLVAVADHLLRIPRMPGRRPLADAQSIATREQLQVLVSARGRPGAPRLREALMRARDGAASRPETWVRMLLIDAGLPEPVLDYDVRDASGRFLGCSELAYPEQKVAIEYESDTHLTRAQLARDIDKYRDYADAGWEAVRLTSGHVFLRPTEAVHRVSAALHRR